jgi:hypothetical protein
MASAPAGVPEDLKKRLAAAAEKSGNPGVAKGLGNSASISTRRVAGMKQSRQQMQSGIAEVTRILQAVSRGLSGGGWGPPPTPPRIRRWALIVALVAFSIMSLSWDYFEFPHWRLTREGSPYRASLRWVTGGRQRAVRITAPGSANLRQPHGREADGLRVVVGAVPDKTRSSRFPRSSSCPRPINLLGSWRDLPFRGRAQDALGVNLSVDVYGDSKQRRRLRGIRVGLGAVSQRLLV